MEFNDSDRGAKRRGVFSTGWTIGPGCQPHSATHSLLCLASSALESQLFGVILATSFLLSNALADSTGTTRPNVVYFLVDDLGMRDCGFSGGKEIKTPHIDKLAARGSTLSSFYVQPLCSPTRAALLTGRYPIRYGLQVGVVRPWAQYGLPLDETTLADDMKSAGYATAIFGKWHLGQCAREFLPTRRGFTKQYGHYNGAIDYFTHERDGGLDWHEDDHALHEAGYSTDLIGMHASKFVREYAGVKPFFLYVPFNAVHEPYQPPIGDVDDYSNLKGARRKYAAMLAATDQAIGAIVAAIDEAGIRDNTLFIFSSDNGGPAPDRITDNGAYRGGKGDLYEGGVRVSAFATWHRVIPPGTTNDSPMHIVDWRPTLQRLCGVRQTNHLPLDGLDIWPTLTQGAPSPHDTILLNSAPQASALRADDWKLVVRAAPDKRAGRINTEAIELFNLRTDPYETSNLATERPDKVQELQQHLASYAAQAVRPKRSGKPESFTVPEVWGEFEKSVRRVNKSTAVENAK